MSHAVIGLLPSFEKAENLVSSLCNAGFENDDISVLGPDDPESHIAYEKHSKAPEGMATGAAAGGIVGGTIGLLAGAGIIALPGGAFLAAGPIMAALAGMATGSALGGVSGGLIGLGIPEYEAKHFEGLLSGNNILVAVHTEDKEEAKIALAAFENAMAKDVHCVDEVSARISTQQTNRATQGVRVVHETGGDEFSGSSADAQTAQVLNLLKNLEQVVRSDADLVEDPKARVLLDTTAEVCHGLQKAIEDYRAKFEVSRPL